MQRNSSRGLPKYIRSFLKRPHLPGCHPSLGIVLLQGSYVCTRYFYLDLGVGDRKASTPKPSFLFHPVLSSLHQARLHLIPRRNVQGCTIHSGDFNGLIPLYPSRPSPTTSPIIFVGRQGRVTLVDTITSRSGRVRPPYSQTSIYLPFTDG